MVDLFIFRRDLRIQDNVGIYKLLNENKKITPIFIYNPPQIDKTRNKYFSDKSVEFLHKSLLSLDKNIKDCNGKLLFFYGKNLEVIEDLLIKNNINSITINEDYSPYSIRRDQNILNLCKKYDVEINIFQDIPLYNFKNIKTKSGTAYKKFKWFYKKTLDMTYSNPIYPNYNFSNNNLSSKFLCNLELIEIKYKPTKQIILEGGRENGMKILEENIPKLEDYKEIRSFPVLENYKKTTTFLSAYLKYGCISVREAADYIKKKLKKNSLEIIRQIVWRDFYYNISYFYPEIFKGLSSSPMKNFKWNESKELFKKWKIGKTGYPLVDAGMRQLFREGYINNRVRLCCASFLIRNLHIDWKKGEKYFAQQLVDYDPSVNNGNWQWVASTSYESQAYYRYMNPSKDLVKYDPKCLYVKKYISELKNESIKAIHNGKYSKKCLYIKPIVDFSESIDLFKEKFSNIQNNLNK